MVNRVSVLVTDSCMSVCVNLYCHNVCVCVRLWTSWRRAEVSVLWSSSRTLLTFGNPPQCSAFTEPRAVSQRQQSALIYSWFQIPELEYFIYLIFLMMNKAAHDFGEQIWFSIKA